MTDGMSFIGSVYCLCVHAFVLMFMRVCVCVCWKCLRFESTLRMHYNDGLSATTAAGICRMSLSTYTEGKTRTETNKRIKAVID